MYLTAEQVHFRVSIDNVKYPKESEAIIKNVVNQLDPQNQYIWVANLTIIYEISGTNPV